MGERRNGASGDADTTISRLRPRIHREPSGAETIQLGAMFTALLAIAVTSGLGALGTVATLAWRADANDRRVEKVETHVDTQGKNQLILDRSLREAKRDVTWANNKLDALLEANGITERLPQPELPRSEIAKPGRDD